MHVMSIYEEYASVENQIKALEEKKAQLRPHILEVMVESGQKKIETALGSFNVSMSKNWTYPETVTNLEKTINQEIKDLKDKIGTEKALAESTGEASCEEVPALRFVSAKL